MKKMNGEQIEEVVAQSARENIGRAIASRHLEDVEAMSVYCSVFNDLMRACEISSRDLEQLVWDYAKKNFTGNDVSSVAGNLLKEATNRNMSQKVFKKLMRAMFPAE